MDSTQPCCNHDKSGRQRDWLLVLCSIILLGSLSITLIDIEWLAAWPRITTFAYAVIAITETMLWGLALGIFFTGLLADIPKELVMAGLGTGKGLRGIVRATMAGTFMDVCNHGVMLIGMQLYRKGASLGQVFAFLIATPWNSFSTMFILWSMVGEDITGLFVLLSLFIAIFTGWLVEIMTDKGRIAPNPNAADLPPHYVAASELKKYLGSIRLSPKNLLLIIWRGVIESLPMLRWVLLGVVMTATARVFIAEEDFHQWFGPTIAGLALTIVMATIIEVCSEGSVPLAADLILRGQATGNGFAFLMAGVSSDYTEVMMLREATGRWKLALLLPLVTLPQVMLISYVLNTWLHLHGTN